MHGDFLGDGQIDSLGDVVGQKSFDLATRNAPEIVCWRISPFSDGKIFWAFVQYAAAGQSEPLFSFVRTDPLRIVSNVPESDAVWVQVGQPAFLEVDAIKGRQFPGKVARLSSQLDESTRTMRVEVELDTPFQGLLPGMFGSVVITLGNYSDAILLPADAISSAIGKQFVFCLENGRVVRRDIVAGIDDGVRVQVTSGLTGSENVITDGRNFVHEGQAVEIME